MHNLRELLDRCEGEPAVSGPSITAGLCFLQVIPRCSGRPISSTLTHRNMLLQCREAFYQHLSKVVLELPSNKCVKDRADAEIKVGKIPSDLKDITPLLCFLTDVCVFQEQSDIKGSPAQEKQDHNEKYQSDDLELGGQHGGYDGDGNPHIAVDDDGQRNEQEQKKLQVKSSRLQLRMVRGAEWIFITVHSVFSKMEECGVKHHLVDTCQDAHQPHHRAGDDGISQVPHPGGTQRVDDCKVSVEGEESKEEDGAVDAQVVHPSNNLAHDVTEDPAGELHVDGHEGKAAHENHRGEDQVQQQDVGHRGHLLKPAENRCFTHHSSSQCKNVFWLVGFSLVCSS